ncbi:hypothetical protein [Nocardioides zeicaulis]|uniref:Uncharacterized protein n=1 Tax=Nocardioides zeicaulis TaxID=1776857 RepID=A0ABV6DZR3_9ACTN
MADLVNPSRRTVVRGAAWSVPVVAVAATAPAFAASPCATLYDFRLDWGTTPYSRASARSATATVSSAGSTPLTVTFASTSSSTGNVPDPARNLTVPANTGTGTTADPVVTSLGGRPGERGVMLYHQSSTIGRDNRQDVVITFSRPVRGLQFYVTDIDTITSPAYSDRVELVGRNASGTAVTYRSTNDGILGTGANGDAWRRTDNSNVNENAAGAQTLVDFTTAAPGATTDVKSLVLTYWNATGGTQYHRVFLGDMTFSAFGC